jgi:hypothetical protein
VYWFDLFSKGKRSKKLAELPHLVYHYGSDDPDDCYSFIEHCDFIAYETGRDRGYDNLPERITEKMRQGLPLTEEDEIRVRGLQEMKEDLEKDPAERKRGHVFKERHEMMTETRKHAASGNSKVTDAKRQKK